MRDTSSTADGQRFRVLRGTLSVASPTGYVVLEAIDPRYALQGSWAAHGRGGLLVAGLLLAAAASITRLPAVGRTLASLAAFLLAGVGAFALAHSPAVALTVLLVLAAAMAWLWVDEKAPRVDAEDEEAQPNLAGVSTECSLALLAWFLVGPGQAATSSGALFAATLALALATMAGARRILEGGPRIRWLVAALLSLPPIVSLAAVLLGRIPPGSGIDLLAVGPLLLLLWSTFKRRSLGEASWLGAVLEHPARLVVVTFLVLSAGGALLLSLPASSPLPITGLDALFTSVSAVCVTGLVVVDTVDTWTTWGHGVLLALMQLGAVGIMTFYAAMMPLLGRRLSMRHERAVAGALSIEDRGHLYGVLRRILAVTLGSEILGTALLFGAFRWEGQLVGEALWKAVFTAVSAFCNAGFTLSSSSLVAYQINPLVLHTVATLVVVGSLSPAAVVALPRVLGRSRRKLSLELKLVYTVSALLLVTGTLAYLAFEWNASLAGLSVADRLHNAWFQAVSRTAGFNSVALEETRWATHAVMIFLMFVGGSPGGTAGGIKTTTFAVLCLAVLAALQGRNEAEAFGRRLHHVSVYKAAAITTMGILSVVVVLIVLLSSQPLPPHVAAFETVSALGTVGWSLGGTAELDEIGKSILILCMLAGRVGPLTLFVILVERRYDSIWVYPHEDVRVG